MVDEPPTNDREAGAVTTPVRPGTTGLIRSFIHRLGGDRLDMPDEGRLSSFETATGWLNSDPLTTEGLRGRVVLVDFWTYTCVNWLRTLPYLRAWDATYRDSGLTIIGVHTPEFGFERDLDNVVAQSHALGVEYPIAVDSDYGVWRAFANNYWPAVYLADVDGRIRYHHFGEGEYAMIEMAVQQLLLDSGADLPDLDLVMVEPQGLEVAADWRNVRSPETYLGYRQATGFASAAAAKFDAPAVYTASSDLSLNSWDLSGTWTIAGHAAVLDEPGGRLAFGFRARDVNLVMGPASKGASIPFRTYLDGGIVEDAHGTDTGADGRGVLTDQRTYQLIRQTGAIVERRFEIEFLEAGVEAYCFTFG
jgi:thiol-disulfide isomerase/thioredoxin